MVRPLSLTLFNNPESSQTPLLSRSLVNMMSPSLSLSIHWSSPALACVFVSVSGVIHAEETLSPP
ncbi:hypothetical protein ABTA72_19860, partial [Acinetobacter baumannii]